MSLVLPASRRRWRRRGPPAGSPPGRRGRRPRASASQSAAAACCAATLRTAPGTRPPHTPRQAGPGCAPQLLCRPQGGGAGHRIRQPLCGAGRPDILCLATANIPGYFSPGTDWVSWSAGVKTLRDGQTLQGWILMLVLGGGS